MANHVLLNNLEHQDLKIITEKSEKYGNNVMYSVVYPFEFIQVQTDYPIFFHKDNASNTYTALALFGFEEKENLFLKAGQWNASYIPLIIEREPFLIGLQSREENGETVENPVIHIDMDSPRISSTEGTNVFLPQGGNTDYINKMSATLKAIHEGKASTKLFMDTLSELDLFESFNLDIQLSDGSNNRLTGFYTINEDKLMALPAEKLAELNTSGLLKLIYMVIASHQNIRALIQIKDNK